MPIFSAMVSRLAFCFSLLFLSGCSLIGIHFNVHNPKRAGKPPELTEARRLLGEWSSARRCFDVKQYRLDIAIDPEKKELSGTVTIIAAAMNDFDTLQLDLYANMAIDKISFEEKTPVFFRRANAVFVVLPRKIKTGERFSLIVQYHGNPAVARKPPWKGGTVWEKDKNGNPWLGVACQSEGAGLWFPCKDHLSDEADSTRIVLTVPKGLSAVSNGRFLGKTENEKQATWNWLVTHPINTYNITYYVGKLNLVQDTYQSKVTGQSLALNHYVLEGNETKARTHFQQLKKHLDFFERHFGPYPWYRDGYKLVESPYAGMEHQTAIAYGNGYENDYQGFDYIILHETAHEWWGNSVTGFDLAEGWIHEGFASYAEALFVEETQGRSAYVNYLELQRLSIVNRRPILKPYGMRYFTYKDEDIYTKGSWTLHSLRAAIGNDELFFKWLKNFAVENKEKFVRSQDVIFTVTRTTGKDLGWLFNQYLYSRFSPELEYAVKDGKLYFRWSERTNRDFAMPQRVLFSSGRELVIHPSDRVRAVELKGETVLSLPDTDYLVKIVENKKLVREYEEPEKTRP